MHQIVVVPKNTSANIYLGFKTPEKQEAIFKRIQDGINLLATINVTDDYGNHLNIPSEGIAYFLASDAEQGQLMLGDVEFAKAKAIKQIQEDPRALELLSRQPNYQPQPKSSIIR